MLVDEGEIVEAFLGALDGESRRDVASISRHLAEDITETAQRWSGIDVDPLEFAAYLGEKASRRAHVDVSLEGLHMDDLYVAFGCLKGDAAAVEAFDEGYLPTVEGVVRKLGGDEDAVAEVKQRMRIQLLLPRPSGSPGLVTYHGLGTLQSWLRVTAARIMLRQMNAERREADSPSLEMISPAVDPELSFMRQMYREQFRQAFLRSLAVLSSRERAILTLGVADGMSPKQMATLYGVHRTTVSRWLREAERHLLDETRRQLTASLRIDAREFESIVALIRSNLGVSLRSIGSE